MEHHHYSAAGFIGGALTGFMSGIKFFIIQEPVTSVPEITFKVLMTVLLAIVGGMTGMLTKDAYTLWMRPAVKRIFSKNVKSKNRITYKKK